MSRNLSQISREIISRGAYPLSSQSNLECKKRVGRQHTTFTLCQNAACSSEYFPLQVDYALEGSAFCRFWLSKLCGCFRLFHAERSRHAYWFSEVIVSGWHFWWFAFWCNSIFFDLFWNVKFKGFTLFDFLQNPSLIWITESDFLLSVNVMWWSPTMSFVTLGPAC